MNFDIKNFRKFKDKIIYVVADYQKKKTFQITKVDENHIETNIRETNLELGIKKANENDLIILSDIDEIPDPKN